MQKNRLLFSLFCWVLPVSLLAQQSKRLNEGWEFLKGDLGSVWEAIRPVTAGSPESAVSWEKVTLPHCVNARDAVDPDMHYYRGPAWYRTQLQVHNPYKDGRTLLHFEGVGQKTELYVYDQLIGKHVGGYDEFTFDITDAVAAFQKHPAFQKQFKGSVPITVKADNSPDVQMIPSGMSDFNIYGGIYRYLNLVYQPAVSIERLTIQPVINSNRKDGSIRVNAAFYDPLNKNNTALRIQVKDPNSNVLYSKELTISSLNATPAISTIAIKNIKRWSPTDPALYTVTVETINTNKESSVIEEKVGFREFEFKKHGPFYLNDQRLLLRGTHRHEDHAGVGAAMTEDLTRKEMIMIKEMGANFIRLGHYQQSSIVLKLCDSLGIMVWEEIPWCRGGLGGDVYQQQAKRMLTNMIQQHFNHPSVIIWGLGNENDWPGDFEVFDKDAIRDFMKQLNDQAHQLDPSRRTAIRRCEFCKDIVDVYSPSIWAGWYHADYSKYKAMAEKANESVDHFFHAEWGGDSHAGRNNEAVDELLLHSNTTASNKAHGGDEAGAEPVEIMTSKDGDWSESYMVNLFDWHLKEQETMPWLTGAAQWVFKDFSTPVRPDNPVPYVNQKGVVERDLNKKESYYVFQSYWSEKPMIHIYGHNWPVRWGDEDDEKLLKVYSNCDEVTLTLNGVSLGARKRNSQDFPAAGLRWNSRFKKGMNKVVATGIKNGIAVSDTIHFNYETNAWGAPANLLIKQIDQTNDTATVEVIVVDNEQQQCLDAGMFVTFSLIGDDTLLDDLGTSSGSRKVQLYNGRAIIKVKLHKKNSIVGVSSENLVTSYLHL